MGQGTYGLLYGTRAPEGVVMEADCDMGEQAGLLDLWRDTPRGGSTPLRAGVVEHCADYSGDGARLVGVWIAVGASGVDGVPDLDVTVPVDELGITEPYAARLAWAIEEWDRFSVWWAQTQGGEFGAPGLWLTTLEVS